MARVATEGVVASVHAWTMPTGSWGNAVVPGLVWADCFPVLMRG